MTDEEWKKVEDALRCPPFGFVRLKADGYNIAITYVREKNPMKYCLAVYVEDKIRIEWVTEDCEIRRKFYRRSVRKCLSKKALKEIGITEKRYEKVMGAKNEFVSYAPYWGSFARLKAHLIKNNSSIELIKANGSL